MIFWSDMAASKDVENRRNQHGFRQITSMRPIPFASRGWDDADEEVFNVIMSRPKINQLEKGSLALYAVFLRPLRGIQT